MKRYSFTLITLFIYIGMNIAPAHAQKEQNRSITQSYLHGWEYALKAGFNIGGTSPLPIPAEIRQIDSYRPGVAIAIEGNATKWLDAQKRWGLTVGLRLESKGMTTKATVKNYSMKIINTSGGELEGLWTGGVKTKVSNSYLTIPILANYKISPRWKLVAGPYFSYTIQKDFSGHVYEGHLRTPDETGSRVNFTDESIATYDFSDELRRFQWGVQVGGEWRAFKHLSVHADLTWGLNDIFRKDFDTITFAMYPIYLNLGFGYAF
ncbi:MAG: porin family protein [Bacteroides sp.]|nr:porin family protein [Bacteroides sp.]